MMLGSVAVTRATPPLQLPSLPAFALPPIAAPSQLPSLPPQRTSAGLSGIMSIACAVRLSGGSASYTCRALSTVWFVTGSSMVNYRIKPMGMNRVVHLQGVEPPLKPDQVHTGAVACSGRRLTPHDSTRSSACLRVLKKAMPWCKAHPALAGRAERGLEHLVAVPAIRVLNQLAPRQLQDETKTGVGREDARQALAGMRGSQALAGARGAAVCWAPDGSGRQQQAAAGRQAEAWLLSPLVPRQLRRVRRSSMSICRPLERRTAGSRTQLLGGCPHGRAAPHLLAEVCGGPALEGAHILVKINQVQPAKALHPHRCLATSAGWIQLVLKPLRGNQSGPAAGQRPGQQQEASGMQRSQR